MSYSRILGPPFLLGEAVQVADDGFVIMYGTITDLPGDGTVVVKGRFTDIWHDELTSICVPLGCIATTEIRQ